MGLSSKPIIIDAKGHLLGRLASTTAKALLQGQRVVIVRCEEINISGSFYRNKLKYLDFLRKRCNVRPSHGPYHQRAPSRILYRVIRGMVPHKLARGKLALHRMKVFEGVPAPYDKQKRMVVPSCMRTLCLKPRRKYCTLGRLSHEVGWKYQDVVKKLEAKRKVKSAVYYKGKKTTDKLRRKAMETAAKKIAPHQKVIESMGYR